jgi:hypothetical protein
VSIIITIINFIFGFFIIYPFLIEWNQISYYLDIMNKNILEFCDILKNELIVFRKEEDYIEINKKNIKDSEKIFGHLMNIIFSKTFFLKPVFILYKNKV